MSRARGVLLTIGAVIGTLCLLLAVAGLAFGVKPLVFRSGSMGPEIPAGALALARPVDAVDLRVGDVVSVVADDRQRVTHRLVAIDGTGASRTLTLQGDANPVPDAETYEVVRADRVFWSVPALGYGVAFLGTPLGMFSLGGFAVGVLALGFWPTRERSGRRAAMVGVPVAAALTVYGAIGTAAAFTDNAGVRAGSIAAATLQAPSIITCQEQGGLLSGYVDLSWTPQPPGVRHRFQFVAGTQVATVTPDVPAGTTTRRFSAQEVAGLLSVAGTITVRLYATAGDNWVSAGFAQRTIRRTSLVGLGLDVRCS